MDSNRKRDLREEKNYFKPILRMLQDNGGELEGISQIDRLIPSYTDFTEDEVNYSEITPKGNKYMPYLLGRNFALKNLQVAKYVTYSRNEPVKLTPDGLNIDIESLDFDRDIYSRSMEYWNKKHEERVQKNQDKKDILEQAPDAEGWTPEQSEDESQDYRATILNKVKSLDPIKFESFSRGLLKKMGFELDLVKGVKASGDGGIDGFAYCTDEQNLKTTRVAIQCKRYTAGAVGSPEINNLRGAIDTHRADYGVLITTSYFSRDAIESSRLGSTPITLIDGNQLVDLMIRYKYKVKEIPTYVVEGDYFDN